MNPILYLLPAVYQALTQGLLTGDGGGYVALGYVSGGYVGSSVAAPLLVQGEPVPVYQHLPTGFNGGRYVLLGQPTANPLPGSAACRAWNCTLLLDCVTLFTPGEVSSIPADLMADGVLRRLESQPLQLGGGLTASTARLETLTSVDDKFDGEETDVHRYLRMRFKLYHNS